MRTGLAGIATLGGVAVIVVGAGVLMLWGRLAAREASYRFRMTIDVETPTGPASGAGVIEVAARDKAALAPGGLQQDWGVHGEAVVVALPQGRTLFALLRGPDGRADMARISMKALDPAFQRGEPVASARRIAARRDVRGEADLSPADFPFLVTFRDPADPATVEEATPYADGGARVRRIHVALTEEAVTSRLAAVLGPDFWPRWHAASQAGQRSQHGSALDTPYYQTLFARLSRPSFISETVR